MGSSVVNPYIIINRDTDILQSKLTEEKVPIMGIPIPQSKITGTKVSIIQMQIKVLQ